MLFLFTLILVQLGFATEEGGGGDDIPQDFPFKEVDGSPNVYSVVGMGYNSMFVVTDDGVAVFEPVNDFHSTMVLADIRKVTDKPIKYMFYSHNHWDHSMGGQVWKDEGATLVGHEDSHEWMVANPHQGMVPPDSVWGGEKAVYKLGDLEIELYHFGKSHGLGMTVFLIPKKDVAFIADIVTPDRVLFTIMPDFEPKEMVRTMQEIEKLEFSKAVYCHSNSENMFWGPKEAATLTREFIQDIGAEVNRMYQSGMNPFYIPSSLRLPKYEKWAMYDQWLEMNVWRIFLEGHMGPFPWAPDKKCGVKGMLTKKKGEFKTEFAKTDACACKKACKEKEYPGFTFKESKGMCKCYTGYRDIKRKDNGAIVGST